MQQETINSFARQIDELNPPALLPLITKIIGERVLDAETAGGYWKLQTVKSIKDWGNIGLKQAKDLSDTILAFLPEHNMPFSERFYNLLKIIEFPTEKYLADAEQTRPEISRAIQALKDTTNKGKSTSIKASKELLELHEDALTGYLDIFCAATTRKATIEEIVKIAKEKNSRGIIATCHEKMEEIVESLIQETLIELQKITTETDSSGYGIANSFYLILSISILMEKWESFNLPDPCFYMILDSLSKVKFSPLGNQVLVRRIS